jgi:hypothetical protein
MTDIPWDRWARVAGVPFAILLLVGFSLFGDAPKVDAPGSDVAAFYSDNGGRILTAVPIIAVAFLFFMWFSGAVADLLRQSGQGRLGSTVIGLAGAQVGVAFVVQSMSASLALNVADSGDVGTSQAVHSLSWSLDALAALLVGAIIGAATIGLSRAGIVPAWFMWFGLVAAILTAVRATAWASDGFWSPSGGYLYILLIAGLSWAIVASILLFRVVPNGPTR